MRPPELLTKVFLDSGDPEETRKTISLLGFLDGQTTNPTLVVKNPEVQTKIQKKEKLTSDELLEIYKGIVEDISRQIPQSSVSIEVYSGLQTSSGKMYNQAKIMHSWVPNAHIKFPTTKEGIRAAILSLGDGMKVNMTLCFTQEQAAAVYSATRGAKKGDVYISPFDGRLDDIGQNGINLIEDIQKMYRAGDGHVEVVAASIRNLEHLLYLVSIGIDIVTAPFPVLRNWFERGLILPHEVLENIDEIRGLKPIPYKETDLNIFWENYRIVNELTEKGVVKFSSDWNSLINN